LSAVRKKNSPSTLQSEGIAQETSFAEAVRLFLLNCKIRNLAPTTIEFYKFHLIALERFLEQSGLTLSQLTPSHLNRSMMNHLIDQHLAPNTMRGRIAACHTFFKYLWREGILNTNLAADLKLPKRSNQGIFTFTEEQVQTILQQPDRNTFTGFRDYVMMLVLLETGMRVMELVNMKLPDVLFSEGAIRIPMGKGRKPRIVPVQQTCLQELRTYIRERGPQPFDHVWVSIQNQPLQRATVIKSVRKYCAQANIRGTRGSCHTFRHTMAKFYLFNGGDVFTLMYILGHTSIEMTRKYVDLFNNDIHEQHEKASPLEFIMASDPEGESEGDEA